MIVSLIKLCLLPGNMVYTIGAILILVLFLIFAGWKIIQTHWLRHRWLTKTVKIDNLSEDIPCRCLWYKRIWALLTLR